MKRGLEIGVTEMGDMVYLKIMRMVFAKEKVTEVQRTRIGIPFIFVMLWAGLWAGEILVSDFFEFDHDCELIDSAETFLIR